MLKRFLIGLSLVLSFSTSVAAQEDFCAAAPQDLLAAINGNWSVKQGVGVMASGAGAFPLPSQPPIAVTFQYDPESRLVNVSGSGPAEKMVMFPTVQEAVPQIDEFLIEAEKEGFLGIGEGCDWYGLPLMVGTNTYSLDSSNDPLIKGSEAIIFASLLSGVTVGFCEMAYMWSPFAILVGEDPNTDILEGRTDKYGTPCDEAMREGTLLGQAEIVHPGTMNMTMLVKFQTPNSGGGTLIFEGEKGGFRFAAKANITLTR